MSAGFQCIYTSQTAAHCASKWITHTEEHSFNLQYGLPAAVPERPLPLAAPRQDMFPQYCLNPHDFVVLKRFHERTLWTIGNKYLRSMLYGALFDLAKLVRIIFQLKSFALSCN